MNELEDDSWVREFDVSNPQKTHAGYTVYRVSSKVYPKGFPEGASEVIVFKRYSEIRALYKELKIIYENRNAEKKKFPRFAKGHYFDRFDESVIEERQKQALSLLLFAGNISFLFTSEPFVKFFEGGVKHASRGSSYSDTDQAAEKDTFADDASNEMQPWTPEVYFSEKQDSSDDEIIYEINRDLSSPDLSLGIKENANEDDKTWLSRAMSLCSEGDDIETLASEAGSKKDLISQNDDDVATTGHVLSQGSVDMLPTLLESDDEREDEAEVFVEIVSPRNSNHSENSYPKYSGNSSPGDMADQLESCFREETDHSFLKPLENKSTSSSQDSFDNSDLPPDKDADLISSRTKLQNRTDDEYRETTDSVHEDGFEVITNKPEVSSTEDSIPARKQVGRMVSNIAMSWIDPKKKDYLYQAAQIIQQALYCEANEMFEDAFNKYKICVGILLNGVQHDSDGKRREAVRRKTAQYLVKAEFLFNTYLKHDENDMKDWTVKPQSSCQDITDRSIVDRQFGHLTLASLKVIGVLGKNMLVQCEGLDGVYVVKALHKTNAVHRSSRQENKQTSKSFLKKYVRSSRMVKLHRHFDTNNSIFLLLEYSTGGCLWNHVRSFRHYYCKNPGTSGSPDDFHGASNDISGECEPTSGECELTSGDCESTSGVVKTTSVYETVPNCKLDCDDRENFDGREIEGNEFAQDHILNAVNVEKNSVNSCSELGHGKDEISTFAASNEKKSKPRESSEKISSLIEEGTGLNQNKEKSLKENESKTSQTCQTTCDGVLGCLDHVNKDHSSMDKCVQHWVAELLLAINSVHSCGIILKDLKPSNVLLDGNGRVKLSYFGIWEEVDHSVDPMAVEQFYCAPEISRGEKITVAADWWSLGVLSYELLTGKTLYSTHPWGIYPHSSIIFPSQDISTEARSFLSGLICHNSRERLGSAMDGVDGIKSHAFFQGVDWNELSKLS